MYDEKGQDISITDSFFMISMGTKGVFGLTAQTLLFAMPCIGYFSFMRMRKWKLSSLGIVAPIPVILSLHLIDNLFNAFPNPFFPMFAGGLTSIIGGFRADSALTCYTIDVRNN